MEQIPLREVNSHSVYKFCDIFGNRSYPIYKSQPMDLVLN